MTAFRPNIVVDGESEFDEDFWVELFGQQHTLSDTDQDVRSLRVLERRLQYRQGRRGRERHCSQKSSCQIDVSIQAPGTQPVFGKYAFLKDEQADMVLSVGDQVTVTKRADERPVFDWPLRSKGAQPQI